MVEKFSSSKPQLEFPKIDVTTISVEADTSLLQTEKKKHVSINYDFNLNSIDFRVNLETTWQYSCECCMHAPHYIKAASQI